MRFVLCYFLLSFFALKGTAQAPQVVTSADIYDDIKRLQFLGSVMYVAAHPDDENTRMISYFSNHIKAHTTYLSLTRGDGGQNILGTELREYLGMLRTQELLMARKIDRGHQFFTRANDFGYSKSPEETLRIWNSDEVLKDVVWAIRKFQPDIIINRFSHDKNRRTHGHHTASAMLSYEAFELVGDKKTFPEQLKYVDPWQAKRLFFNTSWWFYGSRENFEKADKSDMASIEIGVFYPSLGKSNNEIAAESRSMHKCQSMGSTPSRGEQTEYLQFLKGDKLVNSNDPFQGINTSFSRLEGGAPIESFLKEIEQNFDFSKPYLSIPDLMKVMKMIDGLEESRWKEVKSDEIRKIVSNCLGLYADAVVNTNMVVPGENLDLNIELTNRSPQKVLLKSIHIPAIGHDSIIAKDLNFNSANIFNMSFQVPTTIGYTNAYWLNEEGSYGMYEVKDMKMRGLPETPRSLKVEMVLEIEGYSFRIARDIAYKETDPIAGEVFKPLEVVPKVSSNIMRSVYVFAVEGPKEVEVLVKSATNSVKGTVTLDVPAGWRIEPENYDYSSDIKGEEKRFKFLLHPPVNQSEGHISSKVIIDGKSYDRSLTVIEYDHIPVQLVYRKSLARVVKVDLKKTGQRIGYIMGAGDEIPNSLEEIGYSVELLSDNDIQSDRLKAFDAVILGVRAFNTVPKLEYLNKELMKYVEEGGTVIVQYNWTRRLVTQDLGPYPLKLSRDRVSVEEAEIRVLDPDHEVLNFPNKITSKDFDGWVQERGLYFPNEWDERYKAIFSSNDPGETPKNGGLLVTKYGEGYYVYTGYSWFRQLPAGVPGAIRIFTNLISLGNRIRP